MRTLLRNLFAPRTPRIVRKAQPFRPTLAALEQRDCPATAIFSAGEKNVSC